MTAIRNIRIIINIGTAGVNVEFAEDNVCVLTVICVHEKNEKVASDGENVRSVQLVIADVLCHHVTMRVDSITPV